jgi:hypothetical protein
VPGPENATVRRSARIFAVLIALDIAAAVVMNLAWSWAVPFLVGWSLSWLTAVAWVDFQEVRRG